MKLTARGRTVLAQVSAERSVTSSLDQSEFKIRTEVALLSDGVIGIKHTFLKPDGRVDHSAGWKVKGKLKTDSRAKLRNDSPALIAQWVRQYEARGYTAR